MNGDPLERAYAELEGLSAALFQDVVVHPVGALRPRALAVQRWRAALLEGRVPTVTPWPSTSLHHVLCQAIEDLDVLAFCSGEPELVDLIVADLLGYVAQMATQHDEAIAKHLAALRSKPQREWKEDNTRTGPTGGGTSTNVSASKTGDAKGGTVDDGQGGWLGRQKSGEAPGTSSTGASEPQALLTEALRLADNDTLQRLSDRLNDTWAPRVAAWRRLTDILGDLRLALALGFDVERRILRHVGWTALESLQRLLAQTPQLQALVRTLGRMNHPKGGEKASILEQVVDPVRRVVEERRVIQSPRVPTEARGIERSGDIGRMLPTEAALLLHPTLRLLWHARRAEAGLATYRYEGQVEEVVRVQQESSPTERSSQRKPERGPIVLCLDTSGSMQGAPEHIAKALVLAVARAAHTEGRACKVVLFSGPGDVKACDVHLGPEGLHSLLELLAMSFHGGTDVDWPLRVALDTLEREGWNRADLLLISDGAFDVPLGLTARIAQARSDHQARVHGVLIGVQPSPSMAEMCDPLHTFTDWAAVGGG